MCRQLARLLADLAERAVEGNATDGQRTRAVGAKTVRLEGRIAVDHLDVVERNAKLGLRDLRPTRRVALAVWRGARDDSCLARRVQAHG